ncbi:hypothetical protein X963_3689 [Burkholderia pseudomallei MSHR7498]|nr:hypothetical protein DO73_5398 [Burkholderia pseudomallei]KGC52610.1 hypothetical protein DM75_4146 [Burkholderia mallei]KGR96650.1 hypothetical protein X977_5523 [Burkholderia pseudomallei MSHR7504]KGS37359.1 hypothetical protein X992_5761 [Burkholderia pseudomallei MSHR5492]KGS41089.1 hypothetical protein X945_4143 [Burkholderia pseudomallei ABCPW 107]KGS53972.1 hypothetical protein X949_5482 [Burkholderia pseudomallei MSHR5609]KGS60989.1 hypothetical protein X990_5553 [Burkholderia pseu
MCTVAEICSTGARVTLSDVPEVLLTATNSEPQVQDAGLAAKAGAYSTASGKSRCRFLLCSLFIASSHSDPCATG